MRRDDRDTWAWLPGILGAVKLHRLQGRKTNALLQRKGKSWKGEYMVVRWMPGTPSSKGRPRALAEGIYLGTFASASVDRTAVKRNRMRRRCREALRLFIEDLPERPSVQLLVSPRPASLDAPFESLQRDVVAFFSHLRP